ncbi:O-antigen ligase domain-containing protein [Flavobacterium sp. LMO8]|uniref:O-antigen ligase family protein n=1 Tax=Flavobacterium sp. LMO8 TaxID=2654244 RepID=UPI0012913D67|nr:O-antigen ligase family protein [Flavobacterium sp. LMO8]MQP24779.1 O-antigen ligase domain-containing protein [Flavobacterium sp. LMO8]
MKSETSQYIKFVIIHLFIGLAVYLVPSLSKLFAIGIILVGYRYVISRRNKNNEVLFVSAYIVGAEVLLRMTDGMFINEYAKYNVLLLMVLGIFYSGISKFSFPYWIFLLLLVPGIVYGISQLNFDTNIRKAIAFNISGPVTLGIASLYCFDRKITFDQVKILLKSLGYPIISITTYLFLYTPSVKDVVVGTYSNFETSGGFGPNQMATILGLGTFVFFFNTIFNSTTKKIQVINLIITSLIAYRGIVTFSRGGMITGVVMIFFLLVLSYFKMNNKGQIKLIFVVAAVFLMGGFIWVYSSIQTGGLIDKRYANQDAKGREKVSKLTGRETLIESELKMFWENPIMGVGVGKNKEYREMMTGIQAASHNELSRMLAEQGMFGVFCLLILFITPFFLYLSNSNNILILSFYLFWLLTINHAAMRLAAPAFIYALSLLKVQFVDETTVSRESIK